MRGLSEGIPALAFAPGDVADWFGISLNTAREWLEKWRKDGFVQPARENVQRIRSYLLASPWTDMLAEVLHSTTDKPS